MIKAIIFDCFGVLATSSWLPFREKYFADNAELYAQATALNKLSDGGKMPYGQFVIQLAAMARMTNAEAQAELETHTPNQPLFKYIEQDLKPKYQIGMLSNAGGNFLEDMFTPDQITLFDAVGLSFELGVAKPDPRAYTLVAEHLGVAPEECVFVDDQPAYCDGARAIGMQAVQYESFEQCQADLSAILN